MNTNPTPTTAPARPEDQADRPAVFSDNVAAPVEPVVEETAEAPVRLAGLRRPPLRNVGG